MEFYIITEPVHALAPTILHQSIINILIILHYRIFLSSELWTSDQFSNATETLRWGKFHISLLTVTCCLTKHSQPITRYRQCHGRVGERRIERERGRVERGKMGGRKRKTSKTRIYSSLRGFGRWRRCCILPDSFRSN